MSLQHRYKQSQRIYRVQMGPAFLSGKEKSSAFPDPGLLFFRKLFIDLKVTNPGQ